MQLSRYRKAVIASIAAGVAIAQALGLPVADGLSDQLVAVFDVLVAVAVVLVPNAE